MSSIVIQWNLSIANDHLGHNLLMPLIRKIGGCRLSMGGLVYNEFLLDGHYGEVLAFYTGSRLSRQVSL